MLLSFAVSYLLGESRSILLPLVGPAHAVEACGVWSLVLCHKIEMRAAPRELLWWTIEKAQFRKRWLLHVKIVRMLLLYSLLLYPPLFVYFLPRPERCLLVISSRENAKTYPRPQAENFLQRRTQGSHRLGIRPRRRKLTRRS